MNMSICPVCNGTGYTGLGTSYSPCMECNLTRRVTEHRALEIIRAANPNMDDDFILEHVRQLTRKARVRDQWEHKIK